MSLRISPSLPQALNGVEEEKRNVWDQGSYALSWKPCQGDSLNLPDHRAQVDQGSQIKMIQVKDMMQDNDLNNSKSKDKGSKPRSQSMNGQSHYKQDKTKRRQSINVKSHIFNVRGDNDKTKQTPTRMSSIVQRSLKKETSTLGDIVSLNYIKSNKNPLYPEKQTTNKFEGKRVKHVPQLFSVKHVKHVLTKMVFPTGDQEIGRSSRIYDEVVQDKRQRDDNDLQDERQDQPKEQEVEPTRCKRARTEKLFGPDFVSFMVENEPTSYREAKKVKADGSIDKYNARLAIKGFRKQEGLYYFDTYSTRITPIKMILAIAALRNWKVHQMNVKITILNGDLEKSTHMNQPEGFMAPGLEGKNQASAHDNNGNDYEELTRLVMLPHLRANRVYEEENLAMPV
ncbi:retrotransposon protein, putative, ty1-copia subclass [Tanacetum coccineum]|uniref:Retrotransposon protein, putative, ty1-copia subclass n=1 Tax=Tanacetum coccineum TaxID=301880 RepID=A0ABQ4X066_9ASTR